MWTSRPVFVLREERIWRRRCVSPFVRTFSRSIMDVCAGGVSESGVGGATAWTGAVEISAAASVETSVVGTEIGFCAVHVNVGWGGRPVRGVGNEMAVMKVVVSVVIMCGRLEKFSRVWGWARCREHLCGRGLRGGGEMWKCVVA